MLIKPLKNKGRGSPKAVLRYLLNKPDDQAKVLKGDPLLSQRLAESLTYQHSYEAWVLSFEETVLDDQVKFEIIAEFEKAFLPFFQEQPERYNITWIEHSDKGRVELNLFMPKVDLLTEKQISLFNASHRSDYELMNNFRDFINAKYGLTSPMDKAKAKLVKGADWLYKAKSDTGLKSKELIEGISQAIEEMLSSGKVSNRDDVVSILAESGFEITRISRSSVSIKNPNGKNNLKLKGVLFDESFTSVAAASENINRRDEISVRGRVDGTARISKNEIRGDLSEFREKLESSIEYRLKTQRGAFTGDRNKQKTGRAFKKFDQYAERTPEIIERSDKSIRADRGAKSEFIGGQSDDRTAQKGLINNIQSIRNSKKQDNLHSIRDSGIHTANALNTGDSDKQIQEFSGTDVPSGGEQQNKAKPVGTRAQEIAGRRETFDGEYRGQTENYVGSESEYSRAGESRSNQANGTGASNETSDNRFHSGQSELLLFNQRVPREIPLYSVSRWLNEGSRGWFIGENPTGHSGGKSAHRGTLKDDFNNDNGTYGGFNHKAGTDFASLSENLECIRQRAEQYRIANGEGKNAGGRCSESSQLSDTARAFAERFFERNGIRSIIGRAIGYVEEFRTACNRFGASLQGIIERIEHQKILNMQIPERKPKPEENRHFQPVSSYQPRRMR